MNISIDVQDAAARALLSRAPGQINIAMRGAMEDATTYTLAIIRRYPAPPPNSQYRRTKTLDRSWSRRISGSGTSIVGQVGSSGNIAPYNRQVQNRERQARVHRGRWPTIQDVAENEAPAVRRMFEGRLQAMGL